MFRLFLRQKIMTAQTEATRGAGVSTGASAEASGVKAKSANTAKAREEAMEVLRNRRVFQRFAIDHKHLTMLNDQDILLIREISAKGFSTLVAPRTFERLVISDLFEGRLRYNREMHDLKVRVAWKAESYVGFEIVDCSRETLIFIKRLIRPMEIAASLLEIEAEFLSKDQVGKRWFHGEHGADLFVWHDEENGACCAWQFVYGADWVEWSSQDGISTGHHDQGLSMTSISTIRASQPDFDFSRGSQLRDQVPDVQRLQFTEDVFMAFASELQESLLATLNRRSTS